MRFGNIPGTSSPARVLHLTDPHLFADKTDSLRGRVTFDSLNAVLDHYRRGDWRADMIALTGDIIQDDSAAAYDHLRQRVAGLDLPVLCVPGNHDVRGLMQEALSGSPYLYCGSIEIGNWLVIGIDSCESKQAGGRITAEELSRLDAMIDASDAPHVLVCLHHPPVAMGSAWLDTVGLANGAEFLQRIQRTSRVRAAIFGHVHQAFDGIHDDIRIIATPSTCAQFLPGSDEFALDNKPPAYRRLELRTDGKFDSELIWVPYA